MNELNAVGEVVSGGLIARSVEPAAGERPDGHSDETRCLNCAAELTGPFCASCGQHAHVHRTLSAFGHDFLHGVLHFEGKIWNTLPMLAWRPGELTRRYIDGQRARFVSPLALFLFSVFLMFAVLQSVGGSINGADFGGAKMSKNTDEAIAEANKEIVGLKKERAHADADDFARIERKIAEQQKSVAVLQRLRKEGLTNVVLSDAKQEGISIHSSMPWLEAALEKAKANPQLSLYKVQSASSKYSWLLIPISIPFLWMLFPFSRRFRPYDHAVFVTYSLAFVTLLIAFATVVGTLGFPAVAAVGALYMPFHMYRQLKGAYGLGRFGALWRTTLLLLFAVLALSLFAMAVLALGLSD